MTKLLCTVAVLFGVVVAAQADVTPKQDEVMPVLIEENGQQFPVIAKQAGEYFPVFIVKGQQPYFADAQGNSHFVSSDNQDAPLFFEKDGKLVEVPKGASSKSSLVLTKGSETHLVHWRGRYYRGYYRYYPRYNRRFYAPRRAYYGYGGFYGGYRRYNYGYSYGYGYGFGYRRGGCFGYTIYGW